MRHPTVLRIVWGLWMAGAAAANTPVQIHLPREVAVQDSALRLGSVAVVRGDPALVETASRIGLGTLVLPNQKVTIDRTTIASRLASNGIPASQVTFSGAYQVVVARAGHTVTGADLAEAARQFILSAAADAGVAQVEVASAPRGGTVVRLRLPLAEEPAKSLTGPQLAA